MRLNRTVGNSARSSRASATGTTSASTKRATVFRNSSCSAVKEIILRGAARPVRTVGGLCEARTAASLSPIDSLLRTVLVGRFQCPTQALRGGLVDPQVDSGAGDDDTVVATGGVDPDVIVQHVVEHAGRISGERIAVAAGTRLLERDDVAVRELPRRLSMNGLFVRARIDQRSGEDSRLATEEPVRRERLALGQVRQLAVIGEKAHVPPDPAATAERAGSGGVADQLEAFHHDRLVGPLGLRGEVRGG